jgi:hypothetical protein
MAARVHPIVFDDVRSIQSVPQADATTGELRPSGMLRQLAGWWGRMTGSQAASSAKNDEILNQQVTFLIAFMATAADLRYHVLQMPAARCHRLLAFLSAVLTPERREQAMLYLTACMSFADVGSDVFSMSISYRDGRTRAASGLLALVAFSMSCQIAVVYFVHRHHGKRVLMLEILFVLLGVKPFIDVWRIIHRKVNIGALLDHKNERTFCKVF